MTTVLWFYAGAVLGGTIGFMVACILASNNQIRMNETDEHG